MKNSKKSAQSLIEYGLILAMVAVIAVVVLGKFGTSLTNVSNNVGNQLDTASKNAMSNYCTSMKKADGSACTYTAATGACNCN